MALSRTLGKAARTLLIGAALAAPAAVIFAAPAGAQVIISAGVPPPALPVYAQPVCPGDGYLWTPGYWAYGPEGYFWVPGTWVRPPQIGYLWTPAYWGWGGSAYLFHPGYWGPHVGFYGGINYGFGYGGLGYEGGYWRNGVFAYNRSVNNIHVNVRNVYEHPVAVRNVEYNHVSFNGGNGGIPYRASAQEEAALRERHIQPTGEQMQHQNFAAQNRQQFASVNRGYPAVSAAPTPGAFHANPSNPAAARIGNFREAGQPAGNREVNAGRPAYAGGRPVYAGGRPAYNENRSVGAPRQAPGGRGESRAAPAARGGGGGRQGGGGGGHQGGGGRGGRH